MQPPKFNINLNFTISSTTFSSLLIDKYKPSRRSPGVLDDLLLILQLIHSYFSQQIQTLNNISWSLKRNITNCTSYFYIQTLKKISWSLEQWFPTKARWVACNIDLAESLWKATLFPATNIHSIMSAIDCWG